jgi:hypothetical protein
MKDLNNLGKEPLLALLPGLNSSVRMVGLIMYHSSRHSGNLR